MFIFDLDGVLADNEHRKHFIAEDNRDAFYDPAEVIKDKVIWPNKFLLDSLIQNRERVRILTARRSNLEDVTKQWMEEHNFYIPLGISEAKFGLITRPINDKRHHSIWKADIVRELNKQDEVMAFYDNEDDNLVEVAKVIGKDKVFDLGQPKIFTQGPIQPSKQFLEIKENFVKGLTKLIAFKCLTGHDFSEVSWVNSKEDSYCNRCWVLKSTLPFEQ